MTTAERTLALAIPGRARWRQWSVVGGRIVLAALLLIVWKISADVAGEFFIADPLKVFERIVSDTASGKLLLDTYVTLKLSAIGFVIGCAAGVTLPFLLRPIPRFSDALEPYIMASVGVPKYALMPLFILWFGIDDAPKLWLVGLLVFYPVFIAVFAGIRSVDPRLINMARVAGASEITISREVIWNSLLPFFFAALKIALPRAVSAAIIGEFLVGNAGIGYMIESSRQQSDTVGVFAGIVVATALVLIINAALVRVDRHFSAWRPTERDMAL